MTSRYIYLHGFASSPGSRKAQFFKERFRERSIDLRIPELDEGDFTALTIGGQLRVVEREAEAALRGAASGGASDIILIGSSLGGYLAALYAARHPEQVAKLVLMAPAFGFPRRWRESLGEHRFRDWQKSGHMKVPHYGQREFGETGYRLIGYQLIEEAAGYEDYPNAAQPTLVLHGSADDVVPVVLAEEFVRRHPETAQSRLFASGHELTDVLDDLWNETSRFLEL